MLALQYDRHDGTVDLIPCGSIVLSCDKCMRCCRLLCCRRQVVLTPRRVEELQTWVAFHRKHESLDMPLDMGTSLECATVEDVSFLGGDFCVELLALSWCLGFVHDTFGA